jgi:pyruvate/2-oxoglutarate dehydrogenase complex dihydrolipoamide acyltransferase (E2) component
MIKITMPRAGQSMEEGTLLRWLKSEGQPVTKGDILFEIETDKTTIEVEALASGLLWKIICPAGKTVPVLGRRCGRGHYRRRGGIQGHPQRRRP